MLLAGALCLSLLLAQGPAVDEPSTITVIGPVELSPGSASAGARTAATDELATELERRGRRLAERLQPVWMPDFVAELELSRWRGSIEPGAAVLVQSEQLRPFDHVGYRSYRSELQVRHDAHRIDAFLADLGARVERGSRRLLGWLVGSALLWGLLGLLYGWFDRLTRGYMPWRLRFVFGGMGAALPGIALLLL